VYPFPEVRYKFLPQFQKLTVPYGLQINAMLITELGFILFGPGFSLTLLPQCDQILSNCLDSKTPLSCQFHVCGMSRKAVGWEYLYRKILLTVIAVSASASCAILQSVHTGVTKRRNFTCYDLKPFSSVSIVATVKMNSSSHSTVSHTARPHRYRLLLFVCA
jgi:hypothetical protein